MWAWLSINPGVAVLPCRSITRALDPASCRIFSVGADGYDFSLANGDRLRYRVLGIYGQDFSVDEDQIGRLSGCGKTRQEAGEGYRFSHESEFKLTNFFVLNETRRRMLLTNFEAIVGLGRFPVELVGVGELLSVLKGAHANLFSSLVQEIRVAPCLRTALSLHLHHCQGGPPLLNLSSREAVLPSTKAGCPYSSPVVGYHGSVPLTLSSTSQIPLEAPTHPLSSRLGAKRRGGTCSFTFGHSEIVVGESPPGSVSPSTQTAGPSPTLRSGRDDKFKSAALPWQWWGRWRDRVKQRGHPHPTPEKPVPVLWSFCGV